jgi:histone H3/H4
VAGIKSISDDVYPYIRALAESKIRDICGDVLNISQTKSVMVEDIYNALKIRGENLTYSKDIGIKTLEK